MGRINGFNTAITHTMIRIIVSELQGSSKFENPLYTPGIVVYSIL